MPVLDFNYDKVQSIILPALENSITKLENSYNKCSFDADDFGTSLSSIKEEISHAKSSVDSLKKWLESSISFIKSTSENLEGKAIGLPVCDISLRESPINYK